jgi:hypothetical protein
VDLLEPQDLFEADPPSFGSMAEAQVFNKENRIRKNPVPGYPVNFLHQALRWASAQEFRQGQSADGGPVVKLQSPIGKVALGHALALQRQDSVQESGFLPRLILALRLFQGDEACRRFFHYPAADNFKCPDQDGFSAARRTGQHVPFHLNLNCCGSQAQCCR